MIPDLGSVALYKAIARLIIPYTQYHLSSIIPLFIRPYSVVSRTDYSSMFGNKGTKNHYRVGKQYCITKLDHASLLVAMIDRGYTRWSRSIQMG